MANKNEFVNEVILLRREISQLKQAQSVEQQKIGGQLARYGLISSFNGIILYADRIEGQGQVIRLSSNVEVSLEASGSRFATSNGSRSTLTRTAVSYMVAGPLGGVIGATNKKHRKDTIHDDRSLRIIIQSLDGYMDIAVNPDKAEKAHQFVSAIKNAVIHYSRQMENKTALERKAEEVSLTGKSTIEKKRQELNKLIENASAADKIKLQSYDRKSKFFSAIGIILVIGAVIGTIYAVMVFIAEVK